MEKRPTIRATAIQLNGRNHADVKAFTGDSGDFHDSYRFVIRVEPFGDLLASDGDWIIKKEDGTFDVLREKRIRP